MLLHWKNYLVGCVLFVGGLATVSSYEPHMEIDYNSNNEEPMGSNENLFRLQEIQNRFLDLVGNSSSELHSLTELMGLLHTDTGKEMGKLFMEGFALGIQQKNSVHVLGQFWTQLQGRLSPTLVESFDDYRDFFKGMDISTLPLIWEQLFKKDDLGNSLAGLPLGQLVDMIQPTASKYGIDVRSLMNSLMGQGENNFRDLILSALQNGDLSSLMNQIINTTANAMQTTDDGKKTQSGDAPKRGKAEKALRLFRPLVASLLKENEIDLDADAVLEVLSPLFNSDIIAQASPWIAMLAGQGDKGGLGSVVASLIGGQGDKGGLGSVVASLMGGQGDKGGLGSVVASLMGGQGDKGGLGSVVASLMGGGQEGGFNPQQMAGLIGGMGALMAAGGNNQMDMGSMLSMASMFMGKPSKKNNNKNKPNKKMKKDDNDLNLSTLMGMAGKLMGDNMNLDTILDFASKGLKSAEKKKSSEKAKLAKQMEQKPNTPTKDSTKTKQDGPKKKSKTSKNILDIIEPILVSMKTDKKCNAKIKDAIDLGKAMLNSKISSFGKLDQILPLLVSYVTDNDMLSASGVKLDTLVSSFSQALSKADWSEFLVSLENKDFRQMLIRNIAPNAAELVVLLAKTETQGKIYDLVVPRVQNFLTSYGLVGVTLDNFPERLAPMLGLFGRNLPFNPTTILVPLKIYLKGLKSWALAGLGEVKSLTTKEVETRVINALEDDVCEAIVSVIEVIRTTPDPHCLPQRLCQVTSDLQPDSLKAAVTRAVSLVSASGPVLATPDSTLLLQTVQAISGSSGDCEMIYPGDCSPTDQEEDDEDSISMDTFYEHVEL